MLVQELMTKAPVACRADHTLNDAARMMWEHDCGAVPVVDDDGRVIAMITDRDVAMAAYTQGLPLSSIGIATAMSKTVVACAPDDPVATAESLMRMQQIRRLPVVDVDGKLVGILSLNDIAMRAHVGKRVRVKRDELDADAVVSTLAAICARHEGRMAAE